MSNRILDYPEATGITSDDYILLDNEGSGAKCIKASALNINMDNYTIKEARGSIASFDDGEDLPLAFMGAYITAIQDLHGYDYPWVGGAGKNKFNPINYESYKQADGSYRLTGINSNAINNAIPSNVVGQEVTFSAYFDLTKEASPTYIRILVSVGGNYSYSDIQANTKGTRSVTFTPQSTSDSIKIIYGSDGSNYFTMSQLQLEIGNQVTSYLPYSNECPISGWSAVDVTINGIQQWDEEWVLDGNYRVSSKNYIPVKANTEYLFGNTLLYSITCYDINKNSLGGARLTQIPNIGYKFTTKPNTYYIKFNVGNSYGTTYNNDISINYPSTDTSYHAYNGQTYNIQFKDGDNPLIVYGGTLDVVSGVLTVDRGYDVYDGSNDEDWRHYGGNRVTVAVDDFTSPASGITANIMCDKLKTISKSQQGGAEYVISGSDEGYHQFMVNVGISDITELRTWLSNNPITVVYPLATPLTYQLTPQMIYSLIGENNIFADTGDSIVDYRKLWVKPEM